MMKSAGGLLCAVGLMLIAGCTLTIVNNDDIGSALEYTVSVNGDEVDSGTIAAGDSVDVNLGLGGTVFVEGVAVDDGFEGDITFDTEQGDTEYTVTWTSGFSGPTGSKGSTRGNRPGK